LNYAIAVIDIGMTNKKVAVYDDALVQVHADYRSFPPLLVDGIETHDLEGMEAWFLDRLAAAAAAYPVKAIAVTTHGATFVCVGADGKPCVPCAFYTHEPGDAFHDRFYASFGSPEALQERTGTPYLKAMINPAKGILFAKERFPEGFARTKHLLNYPQYWGFRLCGKAGAEGTYAGCHTYLWDWTENRWSDVAVKLGIADKMPSGLKDSWDVLGRVTPEVAAKTGLPADTIVTMGIHDSNSSLLPHFAKKGETGFVLNSTGTWCVVMNPVKKYGFQKDELGKVVFFNQSAFRTPVKTAIFLGGLEFETWSKLLMELNGRNDLPPYDPALYDAVLKDRDVFILPEIVPGSGQFPGSVARAVENGETFGLDGIKSGAKVPAFFRNYERAIAVLRISLVLQTLTALERTGLGEGKEVFTEGGFRKNEAYNALLSAALPANKVSLTDIAEATALGAAMTAKMALSGEKLNELASDFTVDYKEVPKRTVPDLASYRAAWLSAISKA
jgi:sugar (pentulose or hexulose) kinase